MKNFFKIFVKIYRNLKNKRYLKKNFPNIKIDELWYRNVLSKVLIVSCKLEQIKLKNIKCLVLIDDEFKACPLNQSPAYQYIISKDKVSYTKYHEHYNATHKEKHNHTCENFERLINNLSKKGYDYTMPICVDKDNQIIDGQHRASYLLKKYGEDFEAEVFKIYTR